MRSAVILAVPEAAEIVDRWREQSCHAKPSNGVPPHVTLLFPFVPATALDDAVISLLAEVIAGMPAFEFALRSAARFPEVLYLAPDPAEPFVHLTDAVFRRFTDHPPYESAFLEVTPHLTVAQGEPAVLAAAERDVTARLPIEARADDVVLLEEVEPDGRRWAVRARLPLSRSTRTRR
jgi:2'-5' RNA ligase